MTYKIEFGSWPLEGGGLFFHNFLVLRDDAGRVIKELNGGGADADGSFNYTATSGPITARETDYARPPNPQDEPRFATQRNSTFVELFSGTQQEVLNRWNAGFACATAIENKKIPYALPGPNSNSVAGTVARCMDLKQPFVAPNDFSKPGSQRQLLTDNEINAIRSPLNLPPVDDGKIKDVPNSGEPEKQGAIRRTPQFREAQPTGQRPAFRPTDQGTALGTPRTLVEDSMTPFSRNTAISSRCRIATSCPATAFRQILKAFEHSFSPASVRTCRSISKTRPPPLAWPSFKA